MKPLSFFVPGVFLLLLGAGNVLIGELKIDQYKDVLAELSSETRYDKMVVGSPLMRMQLEEETTERQFQQQRNALSRLEFYRLVQLGGRLLLMLSAFLIAISLALKFTSPRKCALALLLFLAPAIAHAEVSQKITAAQVKQIFLPQLSDSVPLQRAIAITRVGELYAKAGNTPADKKLKKELRRFAPLFVRELSDSDKSVRLSAIRALGLLRYSPAIPFLIGVINSGESSERSHAALSLGRFGEEAKEAVAYLTAMRTASEDRFGSASATVALDEIGPHFLPPKVRDLPYDIRLSALYMKASMGHGRGQLPKNW